MPFQTLVWVHGVAFEARFPADFPETPSPIVPGLVRFIEKTDLGVKFRKSVTPETQFFHVSIPSPAILNDFSMRIRKVFIFYDSNGATIKSVSIFDGPRLVRIFNNLGWSGNHSTTVEASNQLEFNPAENISKGIGIFVEVDFSGLPLPPEIFNSIRFSTAGVLFQTRERLVSVIQWFSSLFERREKRI